MNINWRSRDSWIKIGSVVLVIVWALWPIPTPVFEQTKDNVSLAVDGHHSLQQTIISPGGNIDGIDIQVENATELPNTTPVVLTIHAVEDGKNLRTITMPLGRVLSSDKIRFRFQGVLVNTAEKLLIELSTPTLSEKHPLFVRYFNDTHELSYRILAPQFQLVSLAQQILHTDTVGTDIALTYEAGGQILHGQNPYNRILKGNLQDNESYATYLPSFYLLSAATQWMGLHTYAQWIAFWRPIFLLFALATAGVLFSVFWRRNLLLLAFFASGFFLLNRWSLYIATVGLFDFIPIFFLVVSLLLFRKRPLLSVLLLGLSLSFRHIGAVVLPLYVIALWQTTSANQRVRKITLSILNFIAIPLTVSLPFIVLNISSFSKSMLFSFTRGPVTHFSVPSVDAFLGLVGPSAKIGMLILLCIVYISYGRKYLNFFLAAFLAFVVFLNFHSVWFAQYMAYAAPLGMLALFESITVREKKE